MYFLYLILKLNTLYSFVWVVLPSEKISQEKQNNTEISGGTILRI